MCIEDVRCSANLLLPIYFGINNTTKPKKILVKAYQLSRKREAKTLGNRSLFAFCGIDFSHPHLSPHASHNGSMAEKLNTIWRKRKKFSLHIVFPRHRRIVGNQANQPLSSRLRITLGTQISLFSLDKCALQKMFFQNSTQQREKDRRRVPSARKVVSQHKCDKKSERWDFEWLENSLLT